uniref:F-box protein AT5G49610-like beta-propeller domain-containing protein n=1 Tax=Arundo donax TaxID=35708 RepID=A0A0A8Y532_ARUDO
MAIVPPPPMYRKDDSLASFGQLLSKEGGDGPSYFWFSFEYNQQDEATAYVYILQDDIWRMQAFATTQLDDMKLPFGTSKMVLVDDRIYMAATVSSIHVLDLTSSSFFTIELPDGVAFNNGDIMLSWAKGSGIYLVHLKELRLCIWLCKEDISSAGDWLLFDTICLRDMFANLTESHCTIEDGHTTVVTINEVGDNAEFMFLTLGEYLVYMDVKSRAVHKVYEVKEMASCRARVCPFMMIWPPIFSVLKN